MRGSLIYKCRLCGKLHKPVGIPNVTEALISVVVGTPLPKEWDGGRNINILDIHSCGNGRTGLSDLVGAEW